MGAEPIHSVQRQARPERLEDEMKFGTCRKEKETESEGTEPEGRDLKQDVGGGFEHSRNLECWKNRTVNCVDPLSTRDTLS